MYVGPYHSNVRFVCMSPVVYGATAERLLFDRHHIFDDCRFGAPLRDRQTVWGDGTLPLCPFCRLKQGFGGATPLGLPPVPDFF
jgi:hypothetical protein